MKVEEEGLLPAERVEVDSAGLVRFEAAAASVATVSTLGLTGGGWIFAGVTFRGTNASALGLRLLGGTRP